MATGVELVPGQGGATRFEVKFDFLVGLLVKGLEVTDGEISAVPEPV